MRRKWHFVIGLLALVPKEWKVETFLRLHSDCRGPGQQQQWRVKDAYNWIFWFLRLMIHFGSIIDDLWRTLSMNVRGVSFLWFRPFVHNMITVRVWVHVQLESATDGLTIAHNLVLRFIGIWLRWILLGNWLMVWLAKAHISWVFLVTVPRFFCLLGLTDI